MGELLALLPPVSFSSPLLGRTEILCSGELHAVCRQKGNWGFASISVKIAAKICYHLGLLTNKTQTYGLRWESAEMRLHGSVFPVWHFFSCTNLVRLFTFSLPGCCMDPDSPGKSFLPCTWSAVAGFGFTGDGWGRRNQLALSMLKWYNKKLCVHRSVVLLNSSE